MFYSQQFQLDIGVHAVVAFLQIVQKYGFEIGQNICRNYTVVKIQQTQESAKGDAPSMTKFTTLFFRVRLGGIGFGMGIGAPAAS